MELQELRGRLVKNEHGTHFPVYGATNHGFMGDGTILEQHSLPTLVEQPVPKSPPQTALPPENLDELVQEKPEDERESWDSKITFLLATIG